MSMPAIVVTQLIIVLLVAMAVLAYEVMLVMRASVMPMGVRVLSAIVLLPLMLFFAFGFVASFEPGPGHWVFRIGYAALLIVGLVALVRLIFARAK